MTDRDLATPILSLVSAIIGGGITYAQSWHSMRRKERQDSQIREEAGEKERLTREETERTAVVAVLADSLLGLLDQAVLIPEDTVSRSGTFDQAEHDRLRHAESVWDSSWQSHVRVARIAALEVRNDPLRVRLLTTLKYFSDWRILDYAFDRRYRSWVLRSAVDELIDSVYAWRRGQSLPADTPRINFLKEAWDLKQEEFENASSST
jgi:hypothetical protein